MPFPDSERVIYDINPLEEVICQLRFPPILRINSEAPAAFQERIRRAYPLFREKQPAEVTAGLPPEIAKLVSIDLSLRSGPAAYDFLSADEVWTVGLTRDFLSLSTKRYDRWENFREHLELPLGGLIEEYSPAFYSRIGLRYRDVIWRSHLGLADVEWSQLLQPHILGELALPDLSKAISHAAREVVVRLNNGRGQVRIQHGLVRHAETGEIGYLIDSDFFTEQRTETNNATEILDHFNRLSGRLFRWCITDPLHSAMRPHRI